jgi:hypothetical protein
LTLRRVKLLLTLRTRVRVLARDAAAAAQPISSTSTGEASSPTGLLCRCDERLGAT